MFKYICSVKESVLLIIHMANELPPNTIMRIIDKCIQIHSFNVIDEVLQDAEKDIKSFKTILKNHFKYVYPNLIGSFDALYMLIGHAYKSDKYKSTFEKMDLEYKMNGKVFLKKLCQKFDETDDYHLAGNFLQYLFIIGQTILWSDFKSIVFDKNFDLVVEIMGKFIGPKISFDIYKLDNFNFIYQNLNYFLVDKIKNSNIYTQVTIDFVDSVVKYDNKFFNPMSQMLIDCQDNDCSICYEPFNPISVKLSCNHFFHLKCILEWLLRLLIENQNFRCPYCRDYNK
jgi:hypothetical protein